MSAAANSNTKPIAITKLAWGQLKKEAAIPIIIKNIPKVKNE